MNSRKAITTEVTEKYIDNKIKKLFCYLSLRTLFIKNTVVIS